MKEATFFAVFVLVVFGAMGGFLYVALTTPPPATYDLSREDWTCTLKRTRHVPMLVGKVTVMRPSTYCVQYTRNMELSR